VVGATSIIITLNLAFSPSFAGAKNSYLFASENGFNTGWVQVGTWSVPGVAPTAVTLSPASGSGLNQMFTLTATTAKSPSDITTAGIIFGAGTVSNACWATYSRSAGTVGLYNDAGTAVTTKPLGSAATLQNNQCAIGYSVVNITGNSLALTIQVVFKSPAFAGTRTTLISAANAWGNTPYSFAGSWTVP
jgi:hypothetical protein